MSTDFKRVLTLFGHSEGHGYVIAGSRAMVLRLIEQLWNRNRLQAERERMRERENRNQRAQIAKRKQADKEALDSAVDVLLLADAFRGSVEALSRDVEDAMRAARLAYERAQREQEAARQALETARQDAITLGSGRRVYFTADGTALYSEARKRISDAATLVAARQALASGPTATTLEALLEADERYDAATQNVARLHETLGRLDEIRTRLNDGVTADELKRLQQETEEIIAALPADVRADYESLRAARLEERPLAYREIDPALAAAVDLKTHFAAAGAAGGGPSVPTQDKPDADREPVYRPAPDFQF